MRIRTIRKIGNGYFIGLTKWDIKDCSLEVGQELDIEPSLVLLSKTKKSKPYKKRGIAKRLAVTQK